jgi:hypothetical protein
MLAVSLCLGVQAGLAQSAAPSSSSPSGQAPKQAPGQSDNPFPGDAPQAPAPSAPAAGQSAPSSAGQTPNQAPGQSGGQAGGGKPDAAGAKGKRESDNPFPGEDPNAPIIPVAPGPGAGSGQGADSGSAARPGRTDSDAAGTSRRDADPDGDPVRSPDGNARRADDDGFGSSREGVRQVPAEDDADAKPGKSTKSKNRAQTIKEDLDIGGFYLDKKNWKAAQGRFSSAFALDAENPDTVWGLAEAERHLQLYKEAAEHYKLFLSYEPDGKRGREARKALEEVQAAQPSASAAVPVK